jgi:uncharacterized protein
MSPTELAELTEEHQGARQSEAQRKVRAAEKDRRVRKVWIDLENSPHVPFFIPIMEELKRRGFEVVLTARDCFQVCELADMAGLSYRKVGRHFGKNRIAKLAGLGLRVLQLAPFILREGPAIGVSHCSRTSIILSALLGIPSINIIDYEFADQRLTGMLGSNRKKWVLTPEVVPSANFEKTGTLPDHILHYPGIKEDVYVPSFRPDPAFKCNLGFEAGDVLVTMRPPASEAHYHSPESDRLLETVFALLTDHPEVKTVLLPRTSRQEAELRQAHGELFAAGRIVVPERALNGLDLIWHSDVVISGGGTMNREAAALGIPVYSIFRGALGAVDKHLAEKGKLILLTSEQEVREKLRLVPRDRVRESRPDDASALEAVVQHIDAVCASRG